MITNLIPFFVILYLLYFFKSGRLNNVLSISLIVSFYLFATNYTHFGFDISIFRYLHRLIGILAVVVLVFYIFRNHQSFLKDHVPWIMALFLFSILISYLGNNINFESYYHYLRNYIFISTVVLYLYFYIDTNEKLEEIFILISIISLILSFCLIFEKFISRDLFYRAGLFYPNSNYLAYALIPGFTLQIFSFDKYKWVKVPIIMLGVFSTSSISSMIGVFFVGLVFLIYMKKKVLFLIALTLSIIFSFSYFEFKLKNNKSDVRKIISRIVLNVVQQNPINGIGYGQFVTKFSLYVDKKIYEDAPSELKDVLISYYYGYGKSLSAGEITTKDRRFSYENTSIYSSAVPGEKMTHNDLLTIISELGLIGLSVVIFLFYKIYQQLKKLLLYRRQYYYLTISLIGGSLIFSMFHNNLTSIMFWLLIYIPFIINKNNEKNLEK